MVSAVDGGGARPRKAVPGERIAITVHRHAERGGGTGDGVEGVAVASGGGLRPG